MDDGTGRSALEDRLARARRRLAEAMRGSPEEDAAWLAVHDLEAMLLDPSSTPLPIGGGDARRDGTPLES